MCGCSKSPAGLSRPVPPRGSFRIKLVDKARHPNCRPACHWPGSFELEVERGFWAKLSDAQKAFVEAHERAHAEPGTPADVNGARCESCADFRAGTLMHAWGFSRAATVAAARVVKSRRAFQAAGDGWDAGASA